MVWVALAVVVSVGVGLFSERARPEAAADLARRALSFLLYAFFPPIVFVNLAETDFGFGMGAGLIAGLVALGAGACTGSESTSLASSAASTAATTTVDATTTEPPVETTTAEPLLHHPLGQLPGRHRRLVLQPGPGHRPDHRLCADRGIHLLRG